LPEPVRGKSSTVIQCFGVLCGAGCSRAYANISDSSIVASATRTDEHADDLAVLLDRLTGKTLAPN